MVHGVSGSYHLFVGVEQHPLRCGAFVVLFILWVLWFYGFMVMALARLLVLSSVCSFIHPIANPFARSFVSLARSFVSLARQFVSFNIITHQLRAQRSFVQDLSQKGHLVCVRIFGQFRFA